MQFAQWKQGDLKRSVPAGKTGKQQLPVAVLPDGAVMPESADIAAHIAQLVMPHCARSNCALTVLFVMPSLHFRAVLTASLPLLIDRLFCGCSAPHCS